MKRIFVLDRLTARRHTALHDKTVGTAVITLNKRRFLQGTVASLGIAVAGKAVADQYPARPIHFIVPFTPGAGTDRTARILAQKLEPILGQPVIVENHGG